MKTDILISSVAAAELTSVIRSQTEQHNNVLVRRRKSANIVLRRQTAPLIYKSIKLQLACDSLRNFPKSSHQISTALIDSF